MSNIAKIKDPPEEAGLAWLFSKRGEVLLPPRVNQIVIRILGKDVDPLQDV